MQTASSAAFDFSRSAVGVDQRIELLKWLGVALMVADHLGQFAGIALPAWPLLGRGAFPIFSFCVGYSLCVVPDARGFMVRLLAFGALAEILGAFTVTGGFPLNVLFSFALAAYVVQASRGGRSVAKWVLIGIGVWLLAYLTEYGVEGVALTLVSWWFWRAPSRVRAFCVLGASMWLASWNQTLAGTVWLGSALLLLLLPVGLPRIKRAFYGVYVGQWPLLMVLR